MERSTVSTADPPTTLAETVQGLLGRSVEVTLPALRPLVARLRAAVRATAFWTGALLPLAYPALLVTGLSGSDALGFLALVVVNALLLVLGHDHNQPA
ncbi:MAG: hypothetical protein ABEI99_00710 [Halobaculum sp.]